MQIAYDGEGMACEFILMTAGGSRSGAIMTAPMVVRPLPRRSAEEGQRIQMTPSGRNDLSSDTSTLERLTARQQPGSGSRGGQRPLVGPPRASVNDESLFFPEDVDRQDWDASNLDNNDEDLLGWDTSAGHERRRMLVEDESRATMADVGAAENESNEQRVAPTQRISQVRAFVDGHRVSAELSSLGPRFVR